MILINFQNSVGNILNKRIFFRMTMCLFLVFSSFNTFAQSQKQKNLEAKRARLKQEIKKVNTLLFNTKKEEKNILQHLRDLNQRIAIRTKLIAAIDRESTVLNAKIRSNKNRVNILKQELKELKEDYADMIYKSYKSNSMQSRMLFVLSSKSFHQAYKRLKYMSQYTDFRKKQGKEIALKTQKIEKIIKDLNVQKILKENLLLEYKEVKLKITSERQAQEILIRKVKSKEKYYIAQIEKKQREEQKIDRQIEKLIRAAIAASKLKSKGTSAGFFLTPEAKLLASKFEKNKGRLPWPVKNALVVRNFGRIPHETIRGITIQSNGIHIATNKGAMAKAIFEGKVLAIQVSSNGLKTIMVQHGNYISLYGNLETVHVQKGDTISLKQHLGKIYTDKVTGKTIVKFQIWKDTQKQNPASWLLKI